MSRPSSSAMALCGCWRCVGLVPDVTFCCAAKLDAAIEAEREATRLLLSSALAQAAEKGDRVHADALRLALEAYDECIAIRSRGKDHSEWSRSPR